MNENNILGCFVSINSGNFNDDQKTKDKLSNEGDLFRTYIWGVKGVIDVFKKIKYLKYGNDIEFILIQFYVNPFPIVLQNLKEIESYKKKEKSIAISISINEDFFEKSEVDRANHIKQSIINRLFLLKEVVKKKKLDTKLDLLISDLNKLFQDWPPV